MILNNIYKCQNDVCHNDWCHLERVPQWRCSYSNTITMCVKLGENNLGHILGIIFSKSFLLLRIKDICKFYEIILHTFLKSFIIFFVNVSKNLQRLKELILSNQYFVGFINLCNTILCILVWRQADVFDPSLLES